MQTIIQKTFRPFFTWLADKVTSAPKKENVFKSLTRLYKTILTKKSQRGIIINFNTATDDFIIFSDQHKGNKNNADDFKSNEQNYIAALNFYNREGFHYINLGDAEELWKYTVNEVLPNNRRLASNGHCRT